MPAMDAVCSRYPDPRSIMPGSTARTAYTWAMTFTAHCSFHTSGGAVSTSPPVAMPALLKQTSTGPSSDTTAPTIPFTDDSSPTSHGTARPPTSLATACAPSSLRSTTATDAPAAAKAREHAAPIPLAPPVTIATFPPRSTPRPYPTTFGRRTIHAGEHDRQPTVRRPG